jgi:hypothetical protein
VPNKSPIFPINLLSMAVNVLCAVWNYRAGYVVLFGVNVFFAGYAVGVVCSHFLRERYERKLRAAYDQELQRTLDAVRVERDKFLADVRRAINSVYDETGRWN